MTRGPGLFALLLSGAGCAEIIDPLRQPYLQDFRVGDRRGDVAQTEPLVTTSGRRLTVSGEVHVPGGSCTSYQLEPDVSVPVRSEIQFLVRAVPSSSLACTPASTWIHYDATLGPFEEGPANLTIAHRAGAEPTVVFRRMVDLR